MSVIAEANAKRKFNGKILDRRIDYAKFPLTQTNVPLETIAANCGRKSEAAFAAVFRRGTGVAAVHYRNWHQSRLFSA
jgi:transcriptional regulator GlxA family with amidase domain